MDKSKYSKVQKEGEKVPLTKKKEDDDDTKQECTE